jgi:PiT family inorganic phosphate transporter
MKGASVRWSLAARMFMAWLITVPSAALVGALAYGLDRLVGGTAGSYVVFGVLVLAAGVIYGLSRRRPVNHRNVNDEWDPKKEPDAVVADAVARHDPTLMRVKKKRKKKSKVER